MRSATKLQSRTPRTSVGFEESQEGVISENSLPPLAPSGRRLSLSAQKVSATVSAATPGRVGVTVGQASASKALGANAHASAAGPSAAPADGNTSTDNTKRRLTYEDGAMPRISISVKDDDGAEAAGAQDKAAERAERERTGAELASALRATDSSFGLDLDEPAVLPLARESSVGTRRNSSYGFAGVVPDAEAAYVG